MSQDKIKDETLSEFLARELDRLDKFGAMWNRKNKELP
jgi:hypothetical protein